MKSSRGWCFSRNKQTKIPKYFQCQPPFVNRLNHAMLTHDPPSIWCSLFTAVLFLCNYFLLSFSFSGIKWFCIGVALRLTQYKSSNLITINAWFKARIRQMIVCYGLSSTRQSLWIVCLDDIIVKQNNVHRVFRKNLLGQNHGYSINCYSLKCISYTRQSNLLLNFFNTLKFFSRSFGVKQCFSRKCLPKDEDDFLCSSTRW